jgi:tetratricopeptide (TPR) repeat protein
MGDKSARSIVAIECWRLGGIDRRLFQFNHHPPTMPEQSLFTGFLDCLYDELDGIFACADGTRSPAARSSTTTTPRPPRSLGECNRAISDSPTNASLYYYRGCIRQDNLDARGAIADFDRAIELDSKMAAAYATRATANLALNRLDEGLADCDRSIELDPNCEYAYHNRGAMRDYRGDSTGAIADFTRCTQLTPNAATYYNLGVTQFLAAQYTPALASLSKSIDLAPEIATYYARSSTLAALGDESGADRDYSLALADETPGAGSLYSHDEHAYYCRALCKLRKSQRESAKADFQIAIDICERLHNATLKDIATAKIAEIDRG